MCIINLSLWAPVLDLAKQSKEKGRVTWDNNEAAAMLIVLCYFAASISNMRVYQLQI